MRVMTTTKMKIRRMGKMTNKELQELLKQYPDDAEVFFSDSYWCWSDPVRSVGYAEYEKLLLLFTV